MPRIAPAAGKAQVVLAIKTASGLRAEVVGEYDEDHAGALLAKLLGPGLEAAAKVDAALGAQREGGAA